MFLKGIFQYRGVTLWMHQDAFAPSASVLTGVPCGTPDLSRRYDILPTSNPEIVEALIWVGILTLIVSRCVNLLVYSSNIENAPRCTHLRWATIFAEKSNRLLDAVLDHAGIDADLMDLFEVYQSQALDPNVNRKRLMDEWRA